MTAPVLPSRSAPGAPSAHCPRCGVSFDCGRRAEPFECWCKQLPALPAAGLDPRGRCLCPECFADALAAAGAHIDDLD